MTASVTSTMRLSCPKEGSDGLMNRRAADNSKEDYDLACMSFSQKSGLYAVRMESEVFYGIKRGDPMARTILLHELGHYYHKHLTGDAEESERYDHERYRQAEEGSVSQRETDADDFAAMYLGREYVVKGLETIKQELLQRVDKECYEGTNTTFRELDLRIARLG